MRRHQGADGIVHSAFYLALADTVGGTGIGREEAASHGDGGDAGNRNPFHIRRLAIMLGGRRRTMAVRARGGTDAQLERLQKDKA
ncbi:hypothetical protein [Cupriavidus necator]|uniref:hypothetical protein n=1 Tax=Cupriavidus necator TaxID=106590 RepID=UPI001E44A228|nr:hypothetical protein [Cupriavidus necator]